MIPAYAMHQHPLAQTFYLLLAVVGVELAVN
jgi:hypothetical protein